MVESKDPVSITDDPGHPVTESENPTSVPRKDTGVNDPLTDEEKPDDPASRVNRG